MTNKKKQLLRLIHLRIDGEISDAQIRQWHQQKKFGIRKKRKAEQLKLKEIEDEILSEQD